MQSKIKTLKDAKKIFSELRKQGKKIIQCHGVFDLLHPGHIRHFQDAKKRGEVLVVSVTSDRYVNKGPGRPAFNALLRMESIAALKVVDYVVLSDFPDAISVINEIKPDCYVKGQEYQNSEKDLTGKIDQERAATEKNGGSVFYTQNLVCSSSKLLNRYFDPLPPNVQEFIYQIKQEYGLDEIIQKIDALSDLKVLIIGDAIIDKYQYINPLGQSGKGFHIVGSCLEKELFLGGSLIIANHIAGYSNDISLLTAVGKNCTYRHFIEQTLNPKVIPSWIEVEGISTLVKKRYLQRDGDTLIKFFETYSSNHNYLTDTNVNEFLSSMEKLSVDCDLVLVADFGNGFTDRKMINAIGGLSNTLAINTQLNSGNRGYNVITHYDRANFICLNEPELRLAMQDTFSPIENLIQELSKRLSCPQIIVTQGVLGSTCYQEGKQIFRVPALNTHVIDRVGAGDSYLALSSLCLAKGYSLKLASFVGSLAAAMDVEIVGNKESINKQKLCKYLTRLMK